MKNPVLSILIPTIRSRTELFTKIYDKLELQARDRDVEILSFCDNKKRSIGLKRDALVQMSVGEYVCFCDDDDNVSDDYVVKLLQAAEHFPDVITFKQKCIADKKEAIIDFDLHNSTNEPFIPDTIVKRRPFHVCAFRGDLARKYHFPDSMYGEDWVWAEQVLKDCKTQVKINQVIHAYIFDSEVTEAR